MLNRTATIILLIVGLIKKILLYKSEFFPAYSYTKSNTEVELDLSNYATKYGLQNAAGVD